MPVEDVFTITGRGTVVTGRIERGILKVNETVDIIGIHPEKQTTTVTGIEMFRKLLDEGRAARTSACCFAASSVRTSSAVRSSSSPARRRRTRFRGTVYILSKDEGGSC